MQSWSATRAHTLHPRTAAATPNAGAGSFCALAMLTVSLFRTPRFVVLFVQLLYHHVRLYLPSISLSSRGSSLAASQLISPAEFRAQAEGTLVPLLQQIMQAITPQQPQQQHAQQFNDQRNNRADEQRLAVYGGGGALVLSSATPSLLQSASDNSSVFLTALIQRSLKHITGA